LEGGLVIASILVGTDGSATAAKAVRQGVELARACDAALHLVSVARTVPAAAMGGPDAPAVMAAGLEWESVTREHLGQLLEELAAGIRARGVGVETHVASGDPAQEIVDVARRVGADLIVVGNRGMKGARRLLGSVPNAISHRAPCSVMIVRTT